MHVYHYCALICGGSNPRQIDGVVELDKPVDGLIQYEHLRETIKRDRMVNDYGGRIVITSLSYLGHVWQKENMSTE